MAKVVDERERADRLAVENTRLRDALARESIALGVALAGTDGHGIDWNDDQDTSRLGRLVRDAQARMDRSALAHGKGRP